MKIVIGETNKLVPAEFLQSNGRLLSLNKIVHNTRPRLYPVFSSTYPFEPVRPAAPAADAEPDGAYRLHTGTFVAQGYDDRMSTSLTPKHEQVEKLSSIFFHDTHPRQIVAVCRLSVFNFHWYLETKRDALGLTSRALDRFRARLGQASKRAC
jgi:hypothetical protein